MGEKTVAVEIDFEGQFRGDLAMKLWKESEKRQVEPATLAADILEAVISDNLFAAVLDL